MIYEFQTSPGTECVCVCVKAFGLKGVCLRPLLILVHASKAFLQICTRRTWFKERIKECFALQSCSSAVYLHLVIRRNVFHKNLACSIDPISRIVRSYDHTAYASVYEKIYVNKHKYRTYTLKSSSVVLPREHLKIWPRTLAQIVSLSERALK